MRTCNIKIKHTGIKRKAGKERAGNSGSEKEAENTGKNRSCFQGNKSGIGRKKHTNSGRATKSKHRLLGIAMLGKKVPKSVVEKILEYNLSAEQLEEIRQCVESGLADAEILQVMENSPSPERMKKCGKLSF